MLKLPQLRGIPVFALEFHLHFYVWQEGGNLRADQRMKQNRKPLRKCFRLLHLCTDNTLKSQIYIHEAQISCLVTGLDKDSWVAYLFIDTYYQEEESSDSVEYYHSQENMELDPLTGGTMDLNLPIWTPREYFLIVYEYRLKQARHSLHNLISRLILKLERKLEPYVSITFPSCKIFLWDLMTCAG